MTDFGRHNLFDRLSCALLVASVCILWAPAAYAEDDPSEPPVEEVETDRASISESEAAELLQLTGEVASRAARMERASQAPPSIDVDDVLRELGSNRSPSQIFSWMEQHVAFEPYRGSLRGVTGTIVAGAANAADQAVLAKRLLEEAGHPVRFVTGRLHDPDAEQILDDALGKRVLVDRGDRSTASFADQSAIGRDSLKRSLQKHIWLEVETEDGFRAFDPIAAPTYGMTPASASERHGELPDSYRARFDFTLVSILDDDRTIEHLAVNGDVARLAFESITLGFEPDPRRPSGKFPVVSYGEQDVRGEPMSVANTRSLELRFRFRIGNREHGWSQYLMRQNGAEDDIFDFDHQHVAIAIAPGWTSEAKVGRLAAETAGGATEVLEEWIEAEADGDRNVDATARNEFANRLLDQIGTALPFAFTHALDRATGEIGDRFGVLPVLTRPRIVTTGLLRDGDTYRVDLRIDGDRLSALTRGGVPEAAVGGFHGMHGVVKDQLIGAMLDTYGGRRAETVAGIFDRAMVQSIPFTTIYGDNLGQMARLTIDGATRQRLEYQLKQRGMTVLAPLRPVQDDDGERFGWWAVDPYDGYVEAHIADALVPATKRRQKEVDTGGLLQSHLELLSRHFAAADRATGGEHDISTLICNATSHLRRLGGAFCATAQPLSLPDTGSCLADPPRPAASVLRFETIDCEQLLAPFRCSAVYADSVTGTDLAVSEKVPGDDEELTAPLCR